MSSSKLIRATVAALLLAMASTLPLHAQTQDESAAKNSGVIIYRNTQYGFCFFLPQSWQGFTIVTDHWTGSNSNGPAGYQEVEHGPMISIRHPLWTKDNRRQDIPIMVFTRAQWDSLQKDDFHIGAAPIGPDELGRNRRHVFALPARYNFAYLTGFEEVDQIVRSKPLHSSCKTN